MVEYQSNLKSLKNMLGISEISMWSCDHLAPYITRIVKYLNLDLIKECGTEGKILDYIHELERVWDLGADKIVHEETEEWAEVVMGEKFLEELEPYSPDRFVFCWTGIVSGILEKMWLIYQDLLNPIKDNKICPCQSGESQKEWEYYRSSDSGDSRLSGGCLCPGYRK